MGMEVAIIGQILVGLALCLPTMLAASVATAAQEARRPAGRGKHALCAAPRRS